MDAGSSMVSPSTAIRGKGASTHPPVSILPSAVAQTFAHVHPLLVVSSFAIRFQALVADPIPTLTEVLPAICTIQAAYVILCLPPAGKDGAGKDKGKPGHKRKVGVPGTSGDEGSGLSHRVVPAILSLLLPLLLGTPFLTIVLVLFGAPATTHVIHTLLCAAHMSVLVGTSLVYVHGTDSSIWREIWGAARPFDSIWGAAVGSAVGAWLGAVPIPLDWDRPWQAYPITIVTGAYLGYALGASVGKTPLLYGKCIQFDVEVDNQEQNTKAKEEMGEAKEETARDNAQASQQPQNQLPKSKGHK